MYELKKKIGKVLTSKFVGTGHSSYEKRIYWAAVSQKVEKHCSETWRHISFVVVIRWLCLLFLYCDKINSDSDNSFT